MIHTILTWLYIGAGVVFLFGAAIFVHEFGHFWVALKCGLKVEAFAIGMGPKIVAWNRNGIEYSIRWIPAGGFVRLPQMITSSAMEGEGATADSIPPAPPLSKILVAIAGPAMNVIFAFVVATVIYFVGLPVPVNPSVIGFVDPGSAEAHLGIERGDRVIAVDGHPVNSWEEIVKDTITALTNVLPVTIRHEGAVAGTPVKTDTYSLTMITSNALGLKTFNLDPMDHLIVQDVKPGLPADQAHIQVKDEVISFAGVPIWGQQQMIDSIQKRGDMPTVIVLRRNGAVITNTVTPALNPATKKVQVGVVFSLGNDVYVIEHPTPLAQIEDVLDQVQRTFSALVHSKQSGVSAKDLSGPVGIISMLAVQWNRDIRLALQFLVLLNINLAILNMLPVPVLDGGHILMAVLERIRRRPLSKRLIEYTTTVFACLLILFMCYVTIGDVKRIPLFRMMFNQQTQIEQPQSTNNLPSPATTPAH